MCAEKALLKHISPSFRSNPPSAAVATLRTVNEAFSQTLTLTLTPTLTLTLTLMGVVFLARAKATSTIVP